MSENITGDTFEREVVQSDRPVLVDFWGPQCGPCLALMPAVEKLEEKYQHKVKVVKLDASQNRRFCLSMKVLALPTFLIFEKGREVDRLAGGSLTIGQIESALNKILE